MSGGTEQLLTLMRTTAAVPKGAILSTVIPELAFAHGIAQEQRRYWPVMRIPMISDSDSDSCRTLVPIQGGQVSDDPVQDVVDVVRGSGDSFGVKHDRLGSPFTK